MRIAPASEGLSLPHAVARLRSARLAQSSKPFLARGGMKSERCAFCRLAPSHCICSLRPNLLTHSGMCLLMHDIEPLKPSNTGWLIADVVQDTFAFGWARTEVDAALLTLLADPQWLPMVVFPGEYVDAQRVVHAVPEIALHANASPTHPVHSRPASAIVSKRPLFILLDGTWPESSKMFRKSPYLAKLPVLSLEPEQISRYQLRRSKREDHFCTAEVAALCLALASETHAAQTLDAYLDVFTNHYLQAKHQLPYDAEDEIHRRLQALINIR